MNQQSTNSFMGSEEQPIYTPSSDERTMAILSHILTLIAGFIPPLIIWLIKKDESKYAGEHAKESLNFQITLLIAYFIGILLTIVLIGVLILMIVGLLQLIFVIIATIKASDNKIYRYPFCIRLIK